MTLLKISFIAFSLFLFCSVGYSDSKDEGEVGPTNNEGATSYLIDSTMRTGATGPYAETINCSAKGWDGELGASTNLGGEGEATPESGSHH